MDTNFNYYDYSPVVYSIAFTDLSVFNTFCFCL